MSRIEVLALLLVSIMVMLVGMLVAVDIVVHWDIIVRIFTLGG